MRDKDVMISPKKGGEEIQRARRVTGVSSPGASDKYGDVSMAPDTEVSQKATRRRFSAEYKRPILKSAEALREQGQIGALLRREGLYHSNLDTWRRQAERGALDALSLKRGPRTKEPERNVRLLKEKEKEILRLKAELKKAELIIEAQKKITEIFQISLEQRQGKSS